MILLSLPAPPEHAPDLQLFPLQQINQDFRNAINRPGKILNRMLGAHSVPSEKRSLHYQVPLVRLSEEDSNANLKGRYHSLARYDPQSPKAPPDPNVRLTSSQRWPSKKWFDTLGPSLDFALSFIDPSSRPFSCPSGSWRRVFLRPWSKVEIAFYVFSGKISVLCDVKWPVAKNIAYLLYSGGNYPVLTVGQFYDFHEMIRRLSADQHTRLLRLASAKQLQRLDAHRQRMEKHKAKTGCIRCEICEWISCCRQGCRQGCLASAWSRGESPSLLKECERCLLTEERQSDVLYIRWPMDRELFRQIGGIDEQGVPILDPVGRIA